MLRILSRSIILILVLWLMGYGASPLSGQAGASTIAISPLGGPPGITVTVVGTSFTANETGIAITYDGSVIASGISANPQGGWSANFIVPPSASGAHIVDAYGPLTQPASVADQTFGVTPSISAGRIGGTSGSSVTVTGSGFGASETGIAVTYDGTTVASGITANLQGGWSANFAVPPSPSGSHTIDANGSITQATIVPEVTFTVTPAISINRASGAPGSSVTVTGSGFGVGETGITVTYDGTSVVSGIAANAQGSWSATLVIPASPPGSHAINAYGALTAVATVGDIIFTTSGGISVNPANGAPGSSITVTGSGFGVGETGITVTYGGTTVVSGISANTQGGWSTSFTIPASRGGSHIIDAYGSSTAATTVSDATLTVTASISINRASGAPGSALMVTGAGFGAGETGITVTYDGTVAAPAVAANAQGGWSINFAVPASASGAHIIDASGASTAAATVSDVTFTINPGISVSQPGGAPESSITVTGSGFGLDETGITVTFDDQAVVSGISANSRGSWSATFIVPALASGPHRIGAYGPVTQATSVNEVSFGIGSGISVSPATAFVGATVTLTGFGFAANSPLTITYDGKEIAVEGTITDGSGSFSKSITIPKSTAGSHTIRVTDRQRNDTKTTFVMESTPPPAPAPLFPGDGARLGILGDATPTLKWSNVTDPSGVTFILQVAKSPDFSQPILEKTAIPGNRYAVTATEALPRGEYYWRIKAVDGASNQGTWSQTWLFRSGFMALGTLLTILALAVVAVAVAVYLLLVRPRRKWEGVPVPEAEIPPIVPGQWRLLEPQESARERPLLRRLALPQPTKRGRTLSTEEMARLKVIADFTQALPLVEPGYTTGWLVDLLQTTMGIEASSSFYEQLLTGELEVCYEPAWRHHPTHQELTTLLQGHPVLQELDSFVDAANHSACEAALLLQEVYRDASAETPEDFLKRGGWGFLSAVYSDTMNWFLGKSLREPSERDYAIKPYNATGEEPEALYLWGAETTSFAEPLIQTEAEGEALQLRALHLKLRRTYRNSDRAKQIVGIMTQLGVQRARLVNAFSQFSRFTQ